LDIKTANSITGGLSNTTKLPCKSYGLPAKECNVGSFLRKVNGSVCEVCYAMRGHYQYPNVQAAQYKRLESIKNDLWVEAMTLLIRESVRHLIKIVHIAWKCPDIKFWLPTQEKALVSGWRILHGIFPPNLIVRLSATMMDVDPDKTFFGGLTSTVTTKDQPITCESFLCPARSNGNRCGDCRTCWDSNIPDITYHAN